MNETTEKKRRSGFAGLRGEPKAPDVSGAWAVGGLHADEPRAVHLHLAGGARSHRRRAKLDGGAQRGPLRLAGLCLCHGRHRRLFRGADVHASGGVPYGGQHPQAGRGAHDESAAGVFRLERLRPHPRAAGRGGGRYRNAAGAQPGRHRGHHRALRRHAGADVRIRLADGRGLRAGGGDLGGRHVLDDGRQERENHG